MFRGNFSLDERGEWSSFVLVPALISLTVGCTVPPVEDIDITLSAVEMAPGEVVTLEVTTSPPEAEATLVWSSENALIASVDSEGMVTAHEPGEVTITVTTTTSAVSDTCAVTVLDPYVAVEGIDLSTESLSLVEGETASLSVHFSPEDATQKGLVWSSADPSTASIDNEGLVTAQAPGLTTITVTSVDGGHQDECEVSVESNDIPLALSTSSVTMVEGQTQNIIATLTPEDPEAELLWSSSNPAIATVDDGEISGLAPGEAVITVSTLDGEASDTCNVEVLTAPEECLHEPLKVCSEAAPCTSPEDGTQFTESSIVPICGKTNTADRPAYEDGEPKTWTDPQGVQRYYCRYSPEAASSAAPLPLVIWMHGGSGRAGNIYNLTNLRDKAQAYPLSTSPGRAGYHLLSLQSRNTHLDYARLNDNSHWDTYYWDLGSPSQNMDVTFLDHIIDAMVGEGTVDPTQIYLMGWSEGGMMSALYGMARHQQPTPGGSNIASIAIYSASSPFDRIQYLGQRCEIDTYPTSNMAQYTLSRSCDIVPCDSSQEASLWEEDSFADVINMEDWLGILDGSIGSDNLNWVILDSQGREETSCKRSCGVELATWNHLLWPDGVNDGSGNDKELEMLAFLKANGL